MSRGPSIVAAVVLAVSSAAFCASANAPADSPPVLCSSGVPGGISCFLSKRDREEARNAFAHGVKLEEHHHLEEAFSQFDKAARLVPEDPQFVTAREMAKGQLVFQHVQKGNTLMAQDARLAAAAEFRAALDLDPDNQFAQQRFADATRSSTRESEPLLPTMLADAGEIHLQPKSDVATFHFRGDVRGLFNVLTTAYGVTAQFDDSVQNHPISFNLDDADFFTALKLACDVSKTMWTALGSHQILLAADTQENHRQYDRMALGTFLLPPRSNLEQATEVISALRTMFDLRFITAGQTANTMEIRAPEPIIEGCRKLLAQLDQERPQVMLDVQVFQISHQFTRDIGLHIPDTFNMYNIPIGALAALGGQNIQQLLNELVSSGGINQAGNSALSALLAQLEGQQNSIFSQPLATFGGGLTFMGLSLDQLSAALSLNESWARTLDTVSMRAAQGNDVTFHLGERYPILNASYAPIYNSPQISQVLGNQSYIPPFPSVSYEDLGLNLKAKPAVHGDTVSMELEMQVRSLSGQSNNGVPIISNREYKGSINLKNDQPAVIAGQFSRTDMLSMSGIPLLSFLPVLNQAAVSHTKEEDDDELLVVITPHLISDINRATPEIWITQR
ncbi:MAG TPA: hypothetical protein VMG31_07815 [Verrucomicrobiae bacterium]|nr:hypothetical protein [Verrucomicrobiae bacterium]